MLINLSAKEQLYLTNQPLNKVVINIYLYAYKYFSKNFSNL